MSMARQWHKVQTASTAPDESGCESKQLRELSSADEFSSGQQMEGSQQAIFVRLDQGGRSARGGTKGRPLGFIKLNGLEVTTIHA
jgi:hypothetical protein